MTNRHLSTDERRIAVRLVLQMHMTEEFAALALDCSQSTVSRLIKRLAETGEIDEKNPSGRLPLYNVTQMQNL